MTRLKKKFDFYTDPGHGWVKVPKQLLEDLGIAEKISTFSYMHGDYAYLEEDCDFSIFMDAMAWAIRPVIFKRHCTDRSSKIRSYDKYNGEN